MKIFGAVFFILFTLIIPQALAQDEKELYVNQEYGFEIRAPKGWVKDFSKAKRRGEAMFIKQSVGKDNLPVLGVAIDTARGDIESALDYVKFILPEYQEIALQNQASFKLAETPHEVEINGIKGARFIFESLTKNGGGFKSIDCKFMKNNLVISLQGVDYPQTFQENLEDFEAMINSFKFIGEETKTNEPANFILTGLQFKPIDETIWGLLKNQILESMQHKNTFKSEFTFKDRMKQELSQNDFIKMIWLITFVSPQSFEVTQRAYPSNEGDMWRVVGDKVYINVGAWMPFPEQSENPQISQMLKARQTIYKMLSFEQYIEIIKSKTPSGIAENIQDKYTVIQFIFQEAHDLFTGELRKGTYRAELIIWVDNKDKTVKFVRTIVNGKDANKEIKEEYEHSFSDYNGSFDIKEPEMAYIKGNK